MAEYVVGYVNKNSKGDLTGAYKQKVIIADSKTEAKEKFRLVNKYAKITKEIHFNDNKYNFNLNELLNLSDQEFRKKFTGSPIKRIGRDRFLRNCCIAAGNSKNKEFETKEYKIIIIYNF